VTAVALAAAAAGCGTTVAEQPAALQLPGQPATTLSAPAGAPLAAPDPTTGTATPTRSAPSTPRTPTTRATARPHPVSTRSVVVVLDPGHNGGNGAHPGEISEEVPAGHGQTKACNTAGTATADGFAEHAFTFDVALRARRILAAHHVTVLLTRTDDHGIGPCVNERAAFGNAHQAAAVVAIHADGHVGGRGFHVIEAAAPPAGVGMASASHRLAVDVHNRFLAESGFGLANYIGAGGYVRRDDLAGLNLSMRPTIFIECGNMRDAGDAARMETAAGRQRAAQAIADGILLYLGK
jgi:N-acetylmuramoyl-L-alanine amidase